MTKIKISEDWLLFIKESEALTGTVPFEPERKTTERHIALCEIVSKASQIIDPVYVNGMITGKYWEYDSLLRTGTEGALRSVIPEIKRMNQLLKEWREELAKKIDVFSCTSEFEKDAFAWSMHDRLICMHPFKTGNGRTARVMFNHIRLFIGLPVHVIKDDEADKYYSRIEAYRDQVFFPKFVHV